MEIKFLKRKFVNGEEWELRELVDNYGGIIEYEVFNAHRRIVEKSGTYQPDLVAIFNNKQEALNFFNNQI